MRGILMSTTKFKQYREEFWSVEEKLRKQMKDYLFINGDNLLIITDDREKNWGIPELTYALCRNTLSMGTVFIGKNKDYDKFLNTKKYNYIIDLQSSKADNTSLYCNDMYTYRKIFDSLSNNIELDSIHTEFVSINSLLEMFCKDEKILVLLIAIPENVRKSFNKLYKTFHSLSKIISWVKRINVNDILPHYNHKSCVIKNCQKEVHKYSALNLPVCYYHDSYLDEYKIADDIGRGIFSYDDFISSIIYRDSFNRTDSRTVDCSICNRSFNTNSIINICNSCLSRAKSVIIYELMLGLTTIKSLENKDNKDKYWSTLKKSIIANGNCPDCDSTVSSRYTFCSSCEERYDWNRVEVALDNNEFSWDEFCSHNSIRVGYVLSVVIEGVIDEEESLPVLSGSSWYVEPVNEQTQRYYVTDDTNR